jgi:hypothetical protein
MSTTCLQCSATHEPCLFTSGSLWCVRPGCRNPHHRTPPSDANTPQQES